LRAVAAVLGTAFALSSVGSATAESAKPIKIGLGMALTGGLSANGKPALLAMQIWRDDINKRGGLLDRPVELIYYDDQTNPATVPGIYTKLLDVDQVNFRRLRLRDEPDRPLLPIVMERKLTLMGVLGLATTRSTISKLFQIQPSGPDPEANWAMGFFRNRRKAQSQAADDRAGGADAEYPRHAIDGAANSSRRLGSRPCTTSRTRRAR